MPDRVIDAAIDKLDDALEHQERLVGEVRALRTSNRRLRTILIMGLVGLAGVGVAVATSLAATNRIEDVVAQQEIDREESRVATCRVRNSGFMAIRDKFSAMFDLLEASVTSPEGREFVDSLRALPDPADTDCDRDGTVGDADDYATD